MKKAGVLLDLPKDRARVNGKWMDLVISKGNHYGINMLPKSESMVVFEGLVAEGLVAEDDIVEETGEEEQNNRRRVGRNRKLLPEDTHKLFLKMRHIHRQLGHPCKRIWIKMLKDAGLWTTDTAQIVDRIHKECNTCKQFANTPSNPVVSMLAATEPGKIVAVDLKEKNLQGFKYIFYGIDVFKAHVR